MIRLFSAPVVRSDQSGSRRECEKQTVARLVCRTFGQGATLDHCPDGAPYINGRPDVFISISHSSDTCILAVSDAPVGVDVESQRAQLVRVMRKYMADCELESLPEDEAAIMDRLLHHWTAKEAIYKLMRTPGLSLREIVLSPRMDSATAMGRECSLSFSRHGEELVAVASFTESHS